jgi:ABC-type glycerol-3-phosphate transport system permease component
MGKFKYVKLMILYIVLITLVVVAMFPLFWGLASSFRSDSELFRYAIPFSSKTLIPQEFTAEAYVRLFRDFHFINPIVNTLMVVIAAISFGCIVNSLAAFAFATFNFRFKKIIFAIVMLSFMIPFEAIALPLYNVVNGFHMVNTKQGIFVPGIADGLILFLFTQFFKELPPSLIDAARVDGAPWGAIFTKIIIPLSIPVFITAGLMIFMGQWNAYLWPLLVARSKSMYVIQIALSNFNEERGTLWSCLYAGSIVSAFIPLFLFLPFQKYFVQGIVSSGVKG